MSQVLTGPQLIKTLPTIKAVPVVDFAPLRDIAEDMVLMMDRGISFGGRIAGAAALHHAQVCDTPFNFFVIARQYKEFFNGRRIIVNAHIIDQKDLVPFEEGCLSFLGRQHVHTRRFSYIEFTYQTPRRDDSLRNPHAEKLSGFGAFLVQHELDHAAGNHIYDGRFDEYNPRIEMSKEK